MRYNCHTQKCDEKGIPQTLGNESLVLPIFKEYKLDIPICKRVYVTLFKLIVKLITLFIPVKQWRKNFRQNMLENIY